MEVMNFWLQYKVSKKVILINKLATGDDLAHALTKGGDEDDIQKRCRG